MFSAPALENLTNAVYERTKNIKEIKHVKLLDFDLDSYGTKVLIKEQFMVGIRVQPFSFLAPFCLALFVLLAFSPLLTFFAFPSHVSVCKTWG